MSFSSTALDALRQHHGLANKPDMSAYRQLESSGIATVPPMTGRPTDVRRPRHA